MTTSVVIASPYNSTHGLVVQVQKAGKTTKTLKVAPGDEIGETLHIDDETVVIAQDKEGAAAPKSR